VDISVNRLVHALASILDSSLFEGIIETVPAYAALLVHYDPLVLSYSQIRDVLRAKIAQAQDYVSRKPKQVRVPVQYGGQFGVDLESVARHLGMPVEEVIRLHTQRTYMVYMMGFTPGFPYMGKLDEALVVPRLETPRTHVPAGTVAIAGSQTGIYPIASPGGWRLIGWTPLKLFEPDSESPFLFAPGDDVKFFIER
jgi:inhibitor of KinA